MAPESPSVSPSVSPSPFLLHGSFDGASPLLLSAPHGGTRLPDDFLATCRLPADVLRRLEDAHVGELARPASRHGVPLIEAIYARAVLDLNRDEDEIDPAMIEGRLPWPLRASERLRHGYGLLPRLAAPGQPIHRHLIPVAVVEERIRTLYRPWHAALAGGLAAARARHGQAVLLDLHSMPRLPGPGPAALVLGDCFGASAAPSLVDWLEHAFAARGLGVARNRPYAGGATVRRHGRPANGIHAVQLEFDRSLYMDAMFRKTAGFAPLARLLADVVLALHQRLTAAAGLLAAE